VFREFSWKPWSRGLPFVNRRRVIEEVVDVLHFLANVLVALGVTDDELEDEYRAKQEVNRQRQRDGYVAVGEGVARCRPEDLYVRSTGDLISASDAVSDALAKAEREAERDALLLRWLKDQGAR
jgi:hypothetical protein